MSEKFLPIEPVRMNDTFRDLRDKINAFGSRINEVKIITGESVFESSDEMIPRAGDVRDFVLAMALVME
jgi:hypothetical protein